MPDLPVSLRVRLEIVDTNRGVFKASLGLLAIGDILEIYLYGGD